VRGSNLDTESLETVEKGHFISGLVKEDELKIFRRFEMKEILDVNDSFLKGTMNVNAYRGDEVMSPVATDELLRV